MFGLITFLKLFIYAMIFYLLGKVAPSYHEVILNNTYILYNFKININFSHIFDEIFTYPLVFK